MCAWRQVPLMMLHHLLTAFVGYTAPGGFGVGFFFLESFGGDLGFLKK